MPVTTTQQAGDLITRSLRTAGILSSVDSPVAEDLADVMLILNGMIDAWGMDGLLVYTKVISAFALTANVQSYPIGIGAAAPFNVTRPAQLQNANLQITTTSPFVEMPLELLDHNGWMSIPVKNITGTFPTKLYYSPDYPNGTLFFWPIPTSGLNVVIDYWNQLSQFTDPTNVFTLPPGYYEAIYLNLAVRLCTPEWGVMQVPPSLAQLASEAKYRIEKLNATPPPQMTVDYGVQGVDKQTGYRNLYNPAPIWTR